MFIKLKLINENFLIVFSSTLLCLLPLALLSGSFLPDLFISLISVIFIFLIIKRGDWAYFKNYFFFFFITYYFYLLFSSIISSDQILSFESSLFYFRFFVFSLATWFLLENKKNLIKYFFISLAVTFAFALFDGIYQIFSINNFFGFECGMRMCLSLDNKMILGGYLVRLTPLVIASVIYFKLSKRNEIFILILILLLTNIIIFLSGERSALFLMLIINFFVIFFIRSINRLKFIFIISLTFSLLLTMFLNPEFKNRNLNYTFEQFEINFEEKNLLIFSKNHDSLIRTSLNMFKDNPIFGVGPKLFRVECQNESYRVNENSCSTHPHNNYIQALAETGIIGFLFIMFLLVYVSIEIIKSFFSSFIKRDDNQFNICLLLCFFINLWPLIPTLNLFNNWINVLYFLPVGFYLYSLNKNIIQK